MEQQTVHAANERRKLLVHANLEDMLDDEAALIVHARQELASEVVDGDLA